MRIRRLHISGFGPFADREFEGLSRGLNVLSGPNEAGKSALRAFIRAILFGFVTGRASAEERAAYEYPPLLGGVEGGLIELEGEDGSIFTVERHRDARTPAAGEVHIARNGLTGDQDMLDSLLHHVGDRLYQNVFSIGLEQLRGLDAEIQDRIAAAGLGSTGGTLPGVRQRLDSDLRALERELSAARTGTRDTRREYEKAQAELEGYADLVAAQEEVGRSLESIRGEITGARRRLARLDMLAASRENWNRMLEVQRQMEGLPHLEFLPPEPVRRLDEAEELRRSIERRVRDGGEQEDHRQRELRSLASDLAPELCTDTAARLIARQSEYLNAVRDIERVRSQAGLSERRLQDGLAGLGEGWDVPALEAFDDSVATRAALEKLEAALARTGRELEAAEAAARQAGIDRDACTSAAEDAGRRLAALGTPPEMTLDQLHERRNALNRLRALVAQRPEARRDVDEAAERLASAEGRRRARLVMAAQFGLSAAVFAAGVVTSIVSAQLGEPKVAQMGYVIAAAGGIGTLTSLAFLLWPFGRRRSSEGAAGAAEESEDAGTT